MYKELTVDGLRMYDDITIPDSRKYGIPFLYFPDGTYLVGQDGKEIVYGEYLVFQDGTFCRVAEDGQKTLLD